MQMLDRPVYMAQLAQGRKATQVIAL